MLQRSAARLVILMRIIIGHCPARADEGIGPYGVRKMYRYRAGAGQKRILAQLVRIITRHCPARADEGIGPYEGVLGQWVTE